MAANATDRPSSSHVRAVSRALVVLDSFAGKASQSLAEISHATGLDKGTTRRLLLTLMRSDYVAQDPDTQHYKLGQAIRQLAANVEHARDLRTIAQPWLLALSNELGVTTFLSVYEEGTAICIDRLHGMRGVEVHRWAIGGTLPLNCGGAPKLLLAYRPDEEIERILAGRLPALNENSITDPDRLRERLKRIRERGWECAVDDVALGITAVAVPVFGNGGPPVCAVSMAGLTPQHVEDGHPVHLDKLREVAARIATRLVPAAH